MQELVTIVFGYNGFIKVSSLAISTHREERKSSFKSMQELVNLFLVSWIVRLRQLHLLCHNFNQLFLPCYWLRQVCVAQQIHHYIKLICCVVLQTKLIYYFHLYLFRHSWVKYSAVWDIWYFTLRYVIFNSINMKKSSASLT